MQLRGVVLRIRKSKGNYTGFQVRCPIRTPDFKSVVLFKFAHVPKSICFPALLNACANLNRTPDLKSGVQKVALSLQPGVYARFEHARQCCQYIGGIAIQTTRMLQPRTAHRMQRQRNFLYGWKNR